MTTKPERQTEAEPAPKPRARKFRVHRGQPLTGGLGAGRSAAQPVALSVVGQPPSSAPGAVPAPHPAPPPARSRQPTPDEEAGHPTGATLRAEPESAEGTGLDAIRAEGLAARQLRTARRVAQRHGLAVSSDFEAVSELRRRGIDPFQQASLLALVQGDDVSGPDEARGADAASSAPSTAGRVQLPQAQPSGRALAPRPEGRQALQPALPREGDAARRAAEILRIQRDIARRRRRKLAFLLARLAVLVILPTALAGWYFARVATPMYATRSEFVIQKAEAAAPGMAGLGGLFQGTSMATQQDSMTVQAYLASRSALQRLDREHGFRAAFSDLAIDPVQRLPADASAEDAYDLYLDRVKISYDPTEGIVKMEVIAPSPAASEGFSRALIGYAEEQVDHLTSRLREDQMADARARYEEAEARRAASLQAWLDIQAEVQQIDPVGETAARTAQISALETQRQQLELELETRLAVPRPNGAQVDALRSQIASIEGLIADLRAEMTQASGGGASLSVRNAELTTAEQDYAFQTLQVQQALVALETAQVEANRQVRYLSLGVEPVASDEPTYPRAFENTVLAFLIFAGLYLMVSLTASILREQVTS